MRVLYSIKSEFVKLIFNREKLYEYRKALCKEDVSTIVIYESRGSGMVVGEFEIQDRIYGTPNDLWNLTKDKAGITKDFFDSYFSSSPIAYAYQIGKLTIYDHPKPLSDFGVKVAPQNYTYIE